MARARAHGLLVFAALLLALVVAVLLWTTAAPEPDVPASAEPPSASHVGVGGAIGLDPAASEEPHARTLEPAAAEPGEVQAAPEKPVSIAPGAASSVSGFVRRRSGGIASEGTYVVARTSHSPRTDAELVSRILRRDPDLPVARTARDGSFRVDGLVPGSNYLFSAIGDGYASVEPPVSAFTGSRDVGIDVCLVYGVAIELREEGGGSLRSSIEVRELNLARTPNTTPLPEGPLLALLGVDLAPYRTPWNRRLLLFTSARLEEPAVHDRIPIRVRIAGYAPVQTGFEAQPVLPALTVHTVELHPTAAGFGEIQLRFLDGDDPTIEAPRTKRWRLVLASTTGIQAEVELPQDRGMKRITGIPHGRYRVSVVNGLDQEIYSPQSPPGEPSTPLEVGDRPLGLPVSLAETSTLEIAMATADPEVAYEGPATFSLARGEPTPDRRSLVGPTATVTFDRPPYVLAGLRSGHYMLFVQEPPGAAPEAKGATGVLDLAPGQRASVRVLVP